MKENLEKGGTNTWIPKEIGDFLRKLKAGEKVACPECKKGIVSGKANDKRHFGCNNCDFRVNMD